MKKIPLIVFFLAAALRCAAGVVSGDDFNADTATSVSVLQQWYNSGGVWTSTGWWNAANCVDAIAGGIESSNGPAQLCDVLAKTYDLNSTTNFEDTYYDDEGWWTEAWIKAYDLTGNPTYLSMAKTIFANVTNGWSTSCGGGVWWDKTETYKNAIPNELFLLNAIRLHQRTPGDSGTGSYFWWATNEWAWFSSSGMINDKDLINDGLTNCANNGEQTWTYNQGVILGGLVDLYKTTGETNYLTEAESLANASIAQLAAEAILEEPCNNSCGGKDVPQFKGIYLRHLAYLYDTDHNSNYYNFLYANAHSVWSKDRNSSNQLGFYWQGPFDSADAARQSSAMMTLSSLAEPSTPLLFFAKGSGDPGFNHAFGQAAGTLGWSCNASTPAGVMQYGPYLASLSPGPHVAHFRIAVSALASSTANLMQLIVYNSGTTQAVYNVPWNAFSQTNQPQDFAVAFSAGPASTQSEEFRIYWNQIPGAPTVTVSDITIDGSHNWTAANLSHNIGRLDGLNAWEADPVRDTASGYLTLGPGTSELAAGPYTACFELKVDNFNWDNSTVATISVVNTDANTTVASQSLTRGEFQTTLYQTFNVNFQASAGVHYDFRTYWNYATNAPRLTARSVVVVPSGGSSFVPIPLTAGSYNEDMIVESTAPAVPGGACTTASMDTGATNTGTSWYEVGYDTSSPTTGLPAPGTAITNLDRPDHIYTLPSSYTAANAALVDASHSSTLTLASTANYSTLSFLISAGYGPVFVDYTVTHADSSQETGYFAVSDWFDNGFVALETKGRVNVVTGAFENVGSGDPHIYSQDIELTNTASAVTKIALTWDNGNMGSGNVAVFALSGVPASSPVANVTVTPLSQTNYVGTSVSFAASATGTAPFAYQWESNNSPILGATNSSLVLSNLSMASAGGYTCVVTNNSGSVMSAAAVLAVLAPPALAASYSSGWLTLTWSGHAQLLQATNITGPWTTNAAATSPCQTNPAAPTMFYRLSAH